MSTIHPLFGEAGPPQKPRSRGPYRRKVTAAEIERAVRAADRAGLTIYAVTVEEGAVRIQTKPGPEQPASGVSAVDDWFACRG